MHNCLLVSLGTYAVMRVKLFDEAIETRGARTLFSSQNTAMWIFHYTKANSDVFRNDLCQSSYRLALTMFDYIFARTNYTASEQTFLKKKYLFDNVTATSAGICSILFFGPLKINHNFSFLICQLILFKILIECMQFSIFNQI